MILEAQDLRCAYGQRAVLKGVNLKVGSGQIMAVLGGNGAGKSTLLKCLNRILPLVGGEVRLDGMDLARMPRHQIARRIAYLPQRQEPDQLTVFDSVLLGRRPHIAWSASRRDHRVVEECLESLGLVHLAWRRMDQLSGGEAQKVALARALAQEPALLLMDEPTSSLDLHNQLEWADLVWSLVRRRGLAAVVALHDLSLALRLADRLALLKNGKVHSDCPVNELDEAAIAQVYGVRVRLTTVEGWPAVVPLGLMEKSA